MSKYEYIVVGYAPAISKQANDFMKACGLGGEGAFVVKTETVELNVRSGDIDKLPTLLQQAYEKELGWQNVVVNAK